MDAVMLSIPIFILASMRSTSLDEEPMEACGWTSASLHTTCIAAICCLCFSFILTGSQLITLGAASPQQSSAFAQDLRRHLPLPIFVSAAGSLVGASALWGHAVLQHGKCNPEVLVLLTSAFMLAYGTALLYLYMSPVFRAPASVPIPEPSLVPLLPVEPVCSNPPIIAGACVTANKRNEAEEKATEEKAITALLMSKAIEPGDRFSSEVNEGKTIRTGSPSDSPRHGSPSNGSPRNRTGSPRHRSGSPRKRASRNSSKASRSSRKSGDAVEFFFAHAGSGKEGKHGSPTSRQETSVGEAKPERFESVFAQRRESLQTFDEQRSGSELDTRPASPKTVTSSPAMSPAQTDNSLKDDAQPLKKDHVPLARARQSILRNPSQPSRLGDKRTPVCIAENQNMLINLIAAPEHHQGKRDSHAAMLEMAVHHHTSPINFENIQGPDESSDESDTGAEPHVAVPLWIMDQKIENAQSENTEDDHDSDVASEDWSGGEDEEEDDLVKPLPNSAAFDLPLQSPHKKRISFFDQQTGTQLPQYSKDKEKQSLKDNGGKPQKKAKEITLAVRSGSAPARMSANTDFSGKMFWKVPRPTKRGTMMPAPIVRGALDKVADADEVEEVAVRGKRPAKSLPATNLPGQVTLTDIESPQASPKNPKTRITKRPSVLSVFSESGVKKDGLYGLPPVNDEDGDQERQVVEVKRQSLIMSTSMMTDILKQKLGRDQFEDRNFEAITEGEEEEIILPFFSAPMKNAFKKCNCQVDPETGHVIHTCMTPAATLCENTQAFQSYVCSEWGSRRASAEERRHSQKSWRQSQREVQSRRGSIDSEMDDEEEEARRKEREREKREEKMKNKRIRNASMLAVVGRAAPAPSKQNVDEAAPDEKKAQKNAGEDSDEDKPEENELHISFQNLQRPPFPDIRESMELEVHQKSDDDYTANEDDCNAGRRPLDMQVETELGHRFELVQPWELGQVLTDPEKREQVLVVDARGRDWVGGHIPLGINLRTSEITSHPESLIKQCLRNRIEHLVFTCMYSVLRARKSAVAVQRAQDEAHRAGFQPYRIRISLLAGGMHGWVNYWINRVDMENKNPYMQDWDAACWCDGGPSQGGLVHVMDALWDKGGQQALSDALVAELSKLSALTAISSTDGSRRESHSLSTTASHDHTTSTEASIPPLGSDLMPKSKRRGSEA